MKKHSLSFLLVFVWFALLLNACAPVSGGAAGNVGGGKPVGSVIRIDGVIDAINGDQWTVNGQTVTVSANALGGQQYNVGDQVSMEFQVNPNGAAQLTSVEQAAAATPAPVVDPTLATPAPVVDPTLATPAPVVDPTLATPAPIVDPALAAATPVPGAVNQFNGIVEAVNGDQWTINGQTFTVPAALLLDPALTTGSMVNLSVDVAADGTLTVLSVQASTQTTQFGWNGGSAADMDDDGADDDMDDDGNEDDSQDDDENEDDLQEDSSDDSNDSQDGDSNSGDDD